MPYQWYTAYTNGSFLRDAICRFHQGEVDPLRRCGPLWVSQRIISKGSAQLLNVLTDWGFIVTLFACRNDDVELLESGSTR